MSRVIKVLLRFFFRALPPTLEPRRVPADIAANVCGSSRILCFPPQHGGMCDTPTVGLCQRHQCPAGSSAAYPTATALLLPVAMMTRGHRRRMLFS